MEFLNDFVISDTDSNCSSDSLVYSDSENDNNYQNINNNTKKIKLYDYLERIKNKIIKYKPLNDQEIYYIKNMASKNDINIIIDIFNEAIKHIETLLN